MHIAKQSAIQPRWETLASRSGGSDGASAGAQLQGPLSDVLGLRRNAPDRFIFSWARSPSFLPLGVTNEERTVDCPCGALPSHYVTPEADEAVCTVAPLSPRG